MTALEADGKVNLAAEAMTVNSLLLYIFFTLMIVEGIWAEYFGEPSPDAIAADAVNTADPAAGTSRPDVGPSGRGNRPLVFYRHNRRIRMNKRQNNDAFWK
jgi:hypothetical protein